MKSKRMLAMSTLNAIQNNLLFVQPTKEMQITSEMTTRMTTTTSRNTRTPAAQSGVIHFDAIQNLVKKYVVFKNGMHFVIKTPRTRETKPTRPRPRRARGGTSDATQARDESGWGVHPIRSIS